MNILTVSAYFSTHHGGVEAVADRLNREWVRLGHAVAWLATDASPAPAAGAGACLPLPSWNGIERRTGVPAPVPGPAALLRIWRGVRFADIVVLHDTLYLANAAAHAAARLQRKPVLIVKHVGLVAYADPLPRLLMRLAEAVKGRAMLRRADQVVFISHLTAAHYAGLRLCRPARVIFNGVDPETFNPGDGQAAARERLGLPARRPIALFVGRFVEKKGLHILQRAAALCPGILWLIAGSGPLDPRDWGAANVTVLGRLPPAALADLYRAADALVLPSRGEGFPLVIQEALGCGLPVVCSDQTATADPDAKAWVTGVALPADDPDRAAGNVVGALGIVIAAPPPARERIAAFASSRYAWPSAAARYAALAQGLVRPQRTNSAL